MKRIVTIILLLSTLLCLFAACKTEEPAPTQTNNNDNETQDVVISDNLPEKNMNNFELRFMTNGEEVFSWGNVTLVPEDYNGEDINDAMFERNAYIEDRFNCDIYSFTKTDARVADTDIQNFAMSGDTSTAPHIIMHYDRNIMISAQYFLDWNNMPYVSIGEEYWEPSVADLFNIRGRQIALSGHFSLGMVSRTLIIMFNKRMYEQYYGDLSTIYDLVESNEWTIEKFYEIAEGVVENPDSIWDDTDQFGLNAAKKETYTAFMVGCDIRFVQKDEDGIPMFTLPSDNYALEKLQKILKLNQDNEAYYDNSTNMNVHSPDDAFESERALFALQGIHFIPKYRAAMEQEFGIMPIPKYNEEQENYRCLAYGGVMACILISTKQADLENIGILMEALAFDSHHKLIPIYKDRLLKTRFASDESSREMLDIAFKSTVCELGINAFEEYISAPLISKVFVPKTDVISSTISSMESSVRTELAKILSKIK